MAASGVDDFNRKLAEFGDTLTETHLVLLIKKMAFELLRRAAFKTRVKTGRARGGYTLSVGVPIDRGGERLDKRGGATIAAGVAALAGITPFTQIFLLNSVFYVVYLEERYGAVELSVLELSLSIPDVR